MINVIMLQIIHYKEIRCQLEIFKSISVIWTNETVVYFNGYWRNWDWNG